MKMQNTNIWFKAVGVGVLLLTMQMAVSAANLVSRYSFNATSGTTAVDSVGGFNGTLQGAAAFNGSGSVTLNGSSGTYVSLPPAQLSGLMAITIDSWFSFTVPNNNVHLFSIDNGNGTGSGGNYLRYNVFDNTPANGHGGTNFFEGYVNWANNVLHGGSVLPTNNTQVHVTLVYDPVNGVKSIYLNGVLSSTYSGSLAALSSFPQNTFTIGKSPWSGYGDLYLKGSINEFRVYSGVLTDSEIAANNTAGPDTIPQITVGVPQISPTNTVYAGETVVLSSAVAGPVNGYHWEWDNGTGGASFSLITGATSLTCTQATAGLLGSYQYHFVATNSSASATSSVVTLTVNAATAPFVTSDTAPSSATRYTGGTVTFTAAFDGNHPITNQWQKSTDGGTTWASLTAQTNTTLTLTNLQLSDAGNYRLAATNAIGNNASTPATLTVNDVSSAKYQWSAPVPFKGLNANQIMTNVSGAFVGAAAFGGTAYTVTLGNGRNLDFTTNDSIASATGAGISGQRFFAYPAGTTNTTGNTNFNAVLAEFSYDGGPKTINVNNLIVGEQYSVQIFGVDDRADAGGVESNRLANFQDPNDAADVSATFKMGDNVYVIGTFTAANTTETIQMNLPTGNAGSLNALVLRALSYTPANQPPTVLTDPQSKTAFAGHPASFTVEASSYILPGYQWQAGPAGGPFTNLNNGGVIVGATSNLLVLTNVAAYNGAQFQVVVSNPAGSVTSGAATLTVLAVPPTSGSASAAVKALSPVAYWPLNETNDPSTGLAGVYDAAGTFDGMYLTAAQNIFNGIVGPQAADGYPQFASGQGALQTAYNTDQSWVTTPALNLNTNTVTIGMWIYPNGDQMGPAGLYVNRNSGTVAGLGYYGQTRLGYKWNNDGSETWGFNTGPLIPTNIWSYVAVAITPTNAILYLINTNGIQSATNTVTHNNMSWGGDEANISIGHDNSLATVFNGKIDEVAVFNHALSASQIQGLTGLVFVNTDPATANFTASVSGSGHTLNFSWAADHKGWQLYTNAVGLSATGSWYPVPGSASGTSQSITVNPAQPNVFFQLRYP
jgi:hypothetical protein